MSVITPDTSLTLEDAIAHLHGDDVGQRYYAAWYLGYLKDPVAVEALIEALSDLSDRTELGGYPLRRQAAESLGRIGDRRAIPALTQTLRCEDLHTQEMAAWALAKLGDPRSGEALLQQLSAPPPQSYEALIEALGSLRHRQATDSIRPYLDDPNERLRFAAARALFQLTGELTHLEMLLAGLAHPDVHLRRAALFDLAETAHLPAAQAIVDADLTANIKLFALKTMVDAAPEKTWENWGQS